MTETWPCSRCGEPTTRQHKTERECWSALKAERDTLRAEVVALSRIQSGEPS